MTLNVAYDITALGAGFGRDGNYCGIFRVYQELMIELAMQDELDISLTAVCGDIPTIDYLNSFLYAKNELLPKGYHFFETCNIHPSLIKAFENVQEIYFSDRFKQYPGRLVRTVGIENARKIMNKINLRHSLDAKYFDLFHSPYHKLPPVEATKGVQRVITVHDLIPILAPQFAPAQDSIDYLQSILAGIDPNYDWVICNSEFTRQEFCDYLGFPEERTFVTHLAPANHFSPVSDQEKIRRVLDKYGIPEGNYFLSLATDLDPRKNLSHLIDCFVCLLRQHSNLNLNLVLAGSKRFSKGDRLSGHESDSSYSKVIYTGYVDDDDLGALYSGAAAFIYPSLYEGFGLPVLEAMRCGTPVIASDVTSIPEVVGKAGILINPRNSDELCEAMLKILFDSNCARELKKRGLDHSQNYSWKRCAEMTVDIYKKVVEKK